MNAYPIVHERQRRVERYWREADGSWQLEAITSGSVPIPYIDFELRLNAI